MWRSTYNVAFHLQRGVPRRTWRVQWATCCYRAFSQDHHRHPRSFMWTCHVSHRILKRLSRNKISNFHSFIKGTLMSNWPYPFPSPVIFGGEEFSDFQYRSMLLPRSVPRQPQFPHCGFRTIRANLNTVKKGNNILVLL